MCKKEYPINEKSDKKTETKSVQTAKGMELQFAHS